jgi:predicted aspartyl protease
MSAYVLLEDTSLKWLPAAGFAAAVALAGIVGFAVYKSDAPVPKTFRILEDKNHAFWTKVRFRHRGHMIEANCLFDTGNVASYFALPNDLATELELGPLAFRSARSTAGGPTQFAETVVELAEIAGAKLTFVPVEVSQKGQLRDCLIGTMISNNFNWVSVDGFLVMTPKGGGDASP